MQVNAQLNHLRIAPRKVRRAARLIKGLSIARAEEQLRFLVKKSALPLNKLLQSAVSNAENNFNLDKDNLFIKEVIVNEGRKLKRFLPASKGQTAPIQKKTSRIKIVLDEKVPGLRSASTKKRAIQNQPTSSSVTEPESKPMATKTEKQFSRKELPKKKIQHKGVFGDIKNIGRKLFRRKSI